MNMFESLDSNGTDMDDVEQDTHCNICKQHLVSPRVLSCLHVFCEKCLTNMLGVYPNDATNSIICPDCNQYTSVGSNGVASLHSDYVMTNILDLNAVDPCSIFCTSCNSKDNAISYCTDCTNFLCGICGDAHKYMHCFKNHQVVLLDKLRDSTEKVAIHKPLFCKIHSSENLKYYCFNCQVPICNDCLTAHKGTEHRYESIVDSQKRIRIEIKTLLISGKAKMDFYDGAIRNLSKSSIELESQHAIALEQIEDSYERFKKILETCRENALKELRKQSSKCQLKIMGLLQDLEKSAEKMKNSCKFTEKVLNQANGAEILSLKKIIGTQIMGLFSRVPQVDVNVSLYFNSNYEKFNTIAQDMFGKFRTDSMLAPKENTPSPTLPGMPPFLNEVSGNHSSTRTLTGSVATSSPISFATSMQSSFDCNMSMFSNNNMMSSDFTSPNSPPAAIRSNVLSAQTNMSCLSIAEDNLQRFTNISDFGTGITDHPPPTYDARSTHLSFADLNSGDHRSSHSFQAMHKMARDNKVIRPIGTKPCNVTGDMNSTIKNAGRSKGIPMQIRCKFGSLGTSRNEFNLPHGFCLGVEETIIIADTNNHRIVISEKNGTHKFQFGVPGKEDGELWYPRKVAVIRTNGKFVVCDRGNGRSRMQTFNKTGNFIKKISIRFIDIVAGLATTNEGYIVAVDSVSPTVFIMSDDGDLIRWFDCSFYVREPSDIAISGSDFFVCDFKGHCVNVFDENGVFQRRIGNEQMTCYPNGIDVSDAGDVLIGDSHGNRFHVSCFSRYGIFQSEYECPYVKVSRCCGLKITSEGYIVTLAKNNHHVLVLNTLYVQ